MSTAAAAAIPVVPPEEPKPLLPYADLPSRWGVTVERLPGGVRVVVPPVPGWRRLGAGFFVGGALLAVFLTIIGASLYRASEWGPLVFNAILYGGGLLWVVLAARYRLRRRIVLEVTRGTVSATYLTGRNNARRMEWPRAKVAEIKLNSSNGKLIVRVAGVSFVELYLGPSPQLNAYVADVLATALREPVGADALAAALAAAPPGSAEGRPGFDGVRSRAVRRALLALCAVVAATGIGMLFLPLPYSAIGVYVTMFAIVPAGIALGTHEKDFYA